MVRHTSEPLPQRSLGKTGLQFPVVGIGCSDFGNRNRVRSPTEADETIAAAMEAGLTYFDTAPYYGFGLSERRAGDALRTFERSDFILSTKVGRSLVPNAQLDVSTVRNGFHSRMPFQPEFDYSYDGVMRSWEASLHRLGLARIDLLLVHDIGAFAHGEQHALRWRQFIHGGLRALEELKSGGAIKAFGLGVNETAVCEEMLDDGEVDCFLLAGRYTLLDHAATLPLLDRCLARGVGVIAAGPYNTGLLAGGTRRTGALRYDYGAAPIEILERVKALEAACDAFDVPLPAAAVQFPLGHPAVVTVLPGVAGKERVAETRRYIDHPIPEPFWSNLRAQALVSDGIPLPNGLESCPPAMIVDRVAARQSSTTQGA